MPEPIEITREFGRQAFGDDPANYDAARPGYPAWVFSTLREACGVGAGSAVLEIGAAGGGVGPVRSAGQRDHLRYETLTRCDRFCGALERYFGTDADLVVGNGDAVRAASAAWVGTAR